MGTYLKDFQTHSDYNTYITGNNKILPNVSYCEDNKEVHYNPYVNYKTKYLTTKALENGTITFNILRWMTISDITSISYSTDKGETWTTTNNTNNNPSDITINVNVQNGDEIWWKGVAQRMGWEEEMIVYEGGWFSSTCNFNVYGNPISLLSGDNFRNVTTLPSDYAFEYLFHNCTKLISAENLSITVLRWCCCRNLFNGCTNLIKAPELPATTLETGCYTSMFKGCSSLTTAPELPATTLATNCYADMFNGCTSLTTAPVLPVTTLTSGCYQTMFKGCTSLTTAPALPATTLTTGCYYQMFHSCTNLTTAPELSATTLTERCYSYMFYGCTNLTTAPVLPATTLVSNCYEYMFRACSKLNYIKAMFTTTPGTSYTNNWVNGVAASGTFVKNSAASWNVSGTSGVPSGWTVQTASE